MPARPCTVPEGRRTHVGPWPAIHLRGGCDTAQTLSLDRVPACRPSADGGALELLFHSLQAEALLRGVIDTARIVVVFSAPDTNNVQVHEVLGDEHRELPVQGFAGGDAVLSRRPVF